MTNIFITGQGDTYETHTQISVEDFRKLVFEKNDKDTVYFFEEMCENNIQIFKINQVEEHMGDKNWNGKYCEFVCLEDL